MPSALSENDAARILQAAAGIWPPGPTFRADAAEMLRSVVDADVVTFNRLNLGSGKRDVEITPPEWAEPMAAQQSTIEGLAHQHPLVDYFLGAGEPRALRISDRISGDEWFDTALYREYFRPMGLTWQMVMPIPSADHFINVVALSRANEDFTDRDAAACEALLPTLALGCGGAPANDDLSVDVAAGWYVVSVGADRHITRVAPSDPEGTLVPGTRVPATLERPMAETGLGKIGRCTIADERWLVRRIVGAPHEELLAARRVRDTRADMLGITARQGEILSLVADGYTNAQIAQTLGIAAGTVRKHLENVMELMDAPNRASAAARWQQTKA